jgi:hypothetical protein
MGKSGKSTNIARFSYQEYCFPCFFSLEKSVAGVRDPPAEGGHRRAPPLERVRLKTRFAASGQGKPRSGVPTQERKRKNMTLNSHPVRGSCIFIETLCFKFKISAV